MNYKDAVRCFYTKLRKGNVRANDALRQAKYAARYDPQTRYGRKHALLPSRYSAYDGEEITELPNGWKIKVEFQHDGDFGPPWKDCDGMGVIKESSYGTPGEYGEYDDWILNSDHRWCRYYDWKATLPEAMRDGWDSKPYGTRRGKEKAIAAMKSTYEYLRRWCNDDWWYVGLIVTLLDENEEELGEDSCWGFESESMDYITDQVRDWAAGLIRTARREQLEAARAEKIANRFTEAMECGL